MSRCRSPWAHGPVIHALALVAALTACSDVPPDEPDEPVPLAPPEGAIYGVFAAGTLALPAPTQPALYVEPVTPPHLVRPALSNPGGVNGQRPAREGVQ